MLLNCSYACPGQYETSENVNKVMKEISLVLHVLTRFHFSKFDLFFLGSILKPLAAFGLKKLKRFIVLTEIPQASRYMSQPLIIGCSVTIVNLHLLRHHSCWEVLRPQCLTSSLMTSLPSPLDGSSTRAAVTAFRYRDEEFWFGGRQERLLVVSWYAYSYLFIGSILNLK